MDTEPLEAAKAIIGEKEPMEVGLARAIAREVHAGQVDKLGVDYFHHPEAVAKPFEEKGEWERAAAAWLHDAVEDSSITIESLRELGISPRVTEIVDLLTRKDDVPADEYYEKIAADPDALEVKVSDMRHNTDAKRMESLDEPTRVRLLNKYIHAAEKLGKEGFAAELRARLA
ncbi:MAG: HD domain-containing protein [Candidatus Microsaccharimonas sp.]